jgi:adenylosuccinate lyase
MRSFIESLDLPADAKQQLRELAPAGYTGLAEKLASKI